MKYLCCTPTHNTHIRNTKNDKEFFHELVKQKLWWQVAERDIPPCGQSSC